MAKLPYAACLLHDQVLIEYDLRFDHRTLFMRHQNWREQKVGRLQNHTGGKIEFGMYQRMYVEPAASGQQSSQVKIYEKLCN